MKPGAKSKVFLIITILIGVATISGCLQEEDDLKSQNCGNDCATLNGQIITGNGTEPLKDASLIVIWKNITSWGTGTIRTKAEGKTDESGRYSMNFQVRADEITEGYLLVEIQVSDDFLLCGNDINYSFAVPDLVNDTTITTNYFIPYRAQLTINAEGAATMSDADYFFVNIFSKFGINAEQRCGSGGSWTKDNPTTEFTLDVGAGLPIIISTDISKGGQYFTTLDSLTLQKGEHTRFTASYK